jgi:thiol-disulfide isomerase/thioredoxin
MKKILLTITLLLSLSTLLQAGNDTLTVTTIKGKVLHASKIEGGLQIDEYKGKVLFVEIYGHRCSYCIKAIDPYSELQEKFKNKLAIVAIEAGGFNEAQLKNFDEIYDIGYDNITQKSAGWLVPYVSQIGHYRGMIPFLAIFDTNGKFYTSFSGPVPLEKLESIIQQLSK